MYQRKFSLLSTVVLCLILLTAGCGSKQPALSTGPGNQSQQAQGKVIIGIGYQAPTAQTWGALIVKNLKLYEKYLSKVDPETQFVVEWFNSTSGPPLTNNMIAGKLQLSFMGDMPILINGEKGQTMRNYQSVFIAFDGKGEKGKNQALVVPKDGVTKVTDLKGATISTVIGSSAHRMLLEVLDKYGLTEQVTITNQDVTVGMTSIEQNKIAAHATWEPYPGLMLFKDNGRILIDGTETQVDYLDGIVADRAWAEANRSYVVAFLQALIEAHKFIREQPEEAARIFAEESGYPLEVAKQMVKSIRFDAAIYAKDLETLQGSRDFLIKLGKLTSLDLEKFVDTSYLEEAVKNSGLEYLTADELKGQWVKDKLY